MEILSNMTHSFTHLDSRIFIGGRGDKRGKPGPDASYDQLWASSMIHMLSKLKITAQPNI